MRSYYSKLLFLCILTVPAGLFLALPYFGAGHPLEGNIIEKDSFLDDSGNKTEILFFGYTECAYICPRSLFTLGEVIDSLKADYPDEKFGGMFLDINAETQINRANQYSLAFSEYITGWNVPREKLKELKEEFGISILKSPDASGEIFHTENYYIVQKKGTSWVIEKVIANETDKHIIYTAIKQSIDINI